MAVISGAIAGALAGSHWGKQGALWGSVIGLSAGAIIDKITPDTGEGKGFVHNVAAGIIYGGITSGIFSIGNLWRLPGGGASEWARKNVPKATSWLSSGKLGAAGKRVGDAFDQLIYETNIKHSPSFGPGGIGIAAHDLDPSTMDYFKYSVGAPSITKLVQTRGQFIRDIPLQDIGRAYMDDLPKSTLYGAMTGAALGVGAHVYYGDRPEPSPMGMYAATGLGSNRALNPL